MKNRYTNYNLAWLKRQAFKFGFSKGTDLQAFRKMNPRHNGLMLELNNGHYAEVIMSWMLGQFIMASGLNIFVEIDAKIDMYEYADFRFHINGENHDVDMKFDKEAQTDIFPNQVAILPAIEDRHRHTKGTMKGDMALFTLLCKVMNKDDVIDIFFDLPDEFFDLIIEVWYEQTSRLEY